MSSSYVVSLSSFNLLFFTQVLTVLTSTLKFNEYVTDKGKTISIPCIADGNIMWIRENGNTIIQTGKFLVLTNVSSEDQGVYICFSPVPPKNLTIMDTNALNQTLTEIEMPSNEKTAINDVDLRSSPEEFSNNLDNLISPMNEEEEQEEDMEKDPHKNDVEFEAVQKTFLTVRTTPGPVSQLYFKASTILGFLIWRFNKTNTGGYPVRSFTAEYRNISYNHRHALSSSSESHTNMTSNSHVIEHEWSRMDPVNIAPNVRQMEVYHLAPNTSYEFRIWANNQLGSGEIVTTNVTTLPETKEEDLIRLLQPDLDNFDPRIWIVAVSIVLGTFVILFTGLCIVLSKECYQAAETERQKNNWEGIELIPNIILNPGFVENNELGGPFTRTVVFRAEDYSDGYGSSDDEISDHEPRMEKFKRKVSVFFTGPTIKRI